MTNNTLKGVWKQDSQEVENGYYINSWLTDIVRVVKSRIQWTGHVTWWWWGGQMYTEF